MGTHRLCIHKALHDGDGVKYALKSNSNNDVSKPLPILVFVD